VDGRVPLDEAAPCYKSAEEVVEAVVSAGLAEIEHRLWPLASLKGTDGARGKGRKKKEERRGKEGRKTSKHF
jgi:tRNA-splicing ligase RtcB